MAKKPPLPSRRTTSEEKSNDDNLPSRVQDAYAKAHKKVLLNYLIYVEIIVGREVDVISFILR